MFCLNSRIGILFRENFSKKSYELRYFFIDDDANLYYIANLPRLLKITKISKSNSEIKKRLEQTGEKSFHLSQYIFKAPKAYSTESVIPFCNRTYIQLKEKDDRDEKEKDKKKSEKTSYMLLGLTDQDTHAIYQQIMLITGKKKRKQKSIIKKKSIHEKNESEAQKRVFEAYIQCGLDFSMERRKQKKDESEYGGEEVEGMAEGKGKQILLSKGMTYNGDFSRNKKHGVGYLINNNLDSMQCQFLNDELAGI